MTLKHPSLLVASLCLFGMLTACGGGGGGGDGAPAAASSSGTLKFAMTDAPSCGYDAVNITVQKLRVNQSSSAGDNDAGWSEIVLNPAKRLNLLNLQNGVLEELGQTPLPAGRYTQLRLILADNGGATPLANSVVPTGGAEAPLKTPSGQQSGVKTNIDITIAANQLADFVLDFDACKSVVSAGASGQYLLKPVVSVIPRFVSGVQGFVDPALAGGSTVVSLQQGGVVVKASAPDATGRVLLQPVPPGSYSLVLTASGRATEVVTGVAVAANLVTSLNTATTALTPPVSATATVAGSAPADTLVSASQTLSGGPTVEIRSGFVDSVSGAYAFPLPVAAPLVASYAGPTLPLAFTADTAVAGKYTVTASLTGFAPKSVMLPTLAAGTTTTANFSFP